MCTHVQFTSKNFQSSITISTSLKTIKKFSKFNFNYTRLKKFQKIFKVQFKLTGFEKNSKNVQSPTQARPE